MTTKRHNGPAGTDLAAALLIFVAGTAFGAVSTMVLGAKSMTRERPLSTQAPQQPQQPAQTGEPVSEPGSTSPDEPAVPVIYRGVVEKNDGASLRVAVVEGVAAPASVTLTAAGSAKISALVAAGNPKTTGTRAADGTLPPPLAPTANPYVEEPRKISDFKVGDVVEFSAAAGIEDGATVEVGYITWIFSKAASAAPGPIGGGGSAPLR